MVQCEECNKDYEFKELKFEKDNSFEGCKEFYCPQGHLLGIMHMQCRTPLRKINDYGKTKYICDTCNKVFAIESKK